MLSDKVTARLVGLLFATTMLAGMVDSYAVIPILKGPIEGLYPQRSLVEAGAFLVLYMSVGVILLAALIGPVLSRSSRLVASAYLVFRIVEGTLLIFGSVAALVMLPLSRAAIQGAAPGAAAYGAMASAIFEARMAAFQIAMTILGFNGLSMCLLLYSSNIVPRPLAALGIAGYALLALSSVLAICGLLDTGGLGSLLYLPGGLFELILFPAWLILKGFRSKV